MQKGNYLHMQSFLLPFHILWCRPNILCEYECYDVAKFSLPAVIIFPRAIYNSCSQCWLSLPHKFPEAPLFSDFCLYLLSSESSVALVVANLGQFKLEQRNLLLTKIFLNRTLTVIIFNKNLNLMLDGKHWKRIFPRCNMWGNLHWGGNEHWKGIFL